MSNGIQERFSHSFWSPCSSTEPIPNYTTGLNVLHGRLLMSIAENEAVVKYLKQRVQKESRCALVLSVQQQDEDEELQAIVDMNAGLRSSFDMVRNESAEAAHCHRVRARMLSQDVLDPLITFHDMFESEVKSQKIKIEESILEFEHTAQSALMTKSVYWSRCRTLELACPDFRPKLPFGFQEDDDNEEEEEQFIGGRKRSSSVTSELNVDQGGVRLGKYTVLPYREVARAMRRMQRMIDSTNSPKRFLGKDIFAWVRYHVASPPIKQQVEEIISLDTETQEICQHLITLKFLRSVPKESAKFSISSYYEIQQNVVERYLRKTRIRHIVDDGQPTDIEKEEDGQVQNTTLEVPPLTSNGVLNGLLGRLHLTNKEEAPLPSTKAQIAMTEADDTYKKMIKSVEKLRKKLEQDLVVYFDDMERLERDRISTIKQAFITMANSLSNTLPMFKETYNRITLFQETLKSDQDIHYIVEQYKTGPYCPKPMIYENYYYGSAMDQIFGVPLEEVTQIYGSYVPPIISKGIQIIDAGIALKFNSKERNKVFIDVWSNVISVKKMNEICQALDNVAGTKLKLRLESYDLNILANLIRVYLLNLPECLLTFDLYDPVKLLYASQQSTKSRISSISNLLATLPSANYHTLKVVSHHFFRQLRQSTNEDMLNHLLSTFSYILMRPRTSSSLNIHDRHPKKLLKDLLTQYSMIFTRNINKVQQSGASRSAIIADTVLTSPAADDENEAEERESRLRRTLLHIMHRDNSSTNNDEMQSPTSPHLIVPPATLFDDPDQSQYTPRESEPSSPIPGHRGELDAEKLSTDVSLMLDSEGQDDAVELGDKLLQLDNKPNRSRASTRGTLDNVVLDPFFDD